VSNWEDIYLSSFDPCLSFRPGTFPISVLVHPALEVLCISREDTRSQQKLAVWWRMEKGYMDIGRWLISR